MILDKSNLNDCKILNTRQASETYINFQDSQDDQDFQERISQGIQKVHISLKRNIHEMVKAVP